VETPKARAFGCANQINFKLTGFKRKIKIRRWLPPPARQE